MHSVLHRMWTLLKETTQYTSVFDQVQYKPLWELYQLQQTNGGLHPGLAQGIKDV